MKKLAIPLAFLLLAALAIPVFAAWLTDPFASISQVGTTLILHKELSGFKNYGETDKAADVLYSGETGTWTFSSTGLPPGTAFQFVISGVLDDHYSVPEASYSMRVVVNGTEVFNAHPPFVHGTPYGKIFTNWQDLPVDANGNWSITITNTSPLASSHWIAFDWIELHISLAERALTPPCWDITGVWDMEAYLGSSIYLHTLTVVDEDLVTGILTGYGDSPSLSYSYNLVGTVDGCTVEMLRTDYPNGLYWAVMEGAIAADGLSMSGTWYDRNGKSGTWVATGVAQAVPHHAEWLPPINLEGWELNEKATLPIKFQLYDCYGNVMDSWLPVVLAVDSTALDLRFDTTEYYYIANYRPGINGAYTAEVSFDGKELASIDFHVREAGTPNGRGNSNK